MDGYSINGKTVLFTGATSGLGKVAAIAIAEAGANVIAFYRSKEAGLILQQSLSSQAKGSIDLVECDLTSLKSVQNACNLVKDKYPKLDIIVNNAGTWNFSFQETVDGIENTLQVNLLAPKLIIDCLLDHLKKSHSPKVINTASGLHQGTINFDNLEFRRNFSGFKAYRQSKLGIILLTRLYHKLHGDQGVHFYAQHPGLVDTGLVRKGGGVSKLFFKIFGKTPEKGAETLINLLTESPASLVGGEYYKNRKVSKTDTRESYSMDLAEKLNEVCNSYLIKILD